MIQIPISVGELLDKVSILTIKSFKILDKEKARVIKKELRILSRLSEPFMIEPEVEHLYTDLLSVNLTLWETEDALRIREKNQNFDEIFIEFARVVYQQNDLRSDIKNMINKITDSDFQEIKQYSEYRS